MVSEAEIEERRKNFTPKQKQIEKGFLSKYAKTVSGANLGAVCE